MTTADGASRRATSADGAAGPTQRREAGSEVVDPDIDLSVPAQRRELRRHPFDVLGVIVVGGVLGAEARHGVQLLLPDAAGAWPWATFLINVSGCLLIGILMVAITELATAHRLVRPFVGVGVLGGYTTFSTATLDSLTLLHAGRPLLALAYSAATPVLSVTACGLGVVVTRLLAGRSPGPPEVRR